MKRCMETAEKNPRGGNTVTYGKDINSAEWKHVLVFFVFIYTH